MAITFSVGGQTVQVDGAASESTLQALVSAVSGSNQRQRQASTQTATELKQAGQAAADTSSSLRDTAGSARQAKSAIVEMAGNMSSSIVAATGQYQVNTATVGEFANNLLSTSAQISREWTRAFVSLATGGFDPIAASTATFKAGLDLASTAVGGVGGAVGKMSTMFGPLGTAGIAAANALTTAVGKAGIDFFKDQLVATTRAMERYNRSGAIFADGLSQMRTDTAKTGLTFESFSRVVEANRDNIKGFGGTLADGVTILANVSEGMGLTIDKSGKTVRNSLLKLGYSVEDQTALAASYLAQQRVIVGIDRIRAMSSLDVATATGKYATDLKVLQELTGKDAKALADKAAKDTMRASLMSKLTDDQRKALIEANRGMQQLGPEAGQTMQNALTRYLTTGTFDPTVVMSEEMRGYIVQIGKGVQSGSADMQDITTKANEVLRTQLDKQFKLQSSIYAQADTVLAAGGQLAPTIQGMVTTATQIVSNTNLISGATEAARIAAEKSKNTKDPLTQNVADITVASASITNSINKIASEGMPKFSTAISELTTSIAKGAKEIENVATGKTSMDQFFEDLKKGLIESITAAWKETSTSIRSVLDEFFKRPGANADEPPKSNARGTPGTGTVVQNFRSGTLAMLHGREAVLTEVQLKNLVSGVSQYSVARSSQSKSDTDKLAAVTPLVIPAPAPVVIPAPAPAVMPDTQTLFAAVTDSIEQSRDSYVTAMRDFQQERINADKQTKKSDQPFPEEFTAAIGKFDTVVLSSAIDNLSSQMVNSSKEQQLSLNAQITKLTELVTAMQENVRASENIANVLA